MKPAVRSAAELPGIDPLYVAHKGTLIVIVGPVLAESVFAGMIADPQGVDSVIIGEATSQRPGTIVTETVVGSSRIVALPVGGQLPRIC